MSNDIVTYNRGARLYITSDGKDIVGNNIPLMIGSDISFRLNSQFGPVTKLSLDGIAGSIAASITFLRDRGFTGSFVNQGFQIWQKTDPIDFSFNIELRMQTSGLDDVLIPSQKIMSTCLPTKQGISLIPPGPSVVRALGLTASKAKELGIGHLLSVGESLYSIRVANYLYFSECIIKQAVPTYSLAVDNAGFPISCKIDISMSTAEIATKNMINDMSKLGSK